VDAVRAHAESGAAVDENLADQLLVFLALGGGSIATPAVTGHAETNAALLDRFGYGVRFVTGGRVPIAESRGR
jgi:RNA 3'-terminal phosphate cyclase (ATP)